MKHKYAISIILSLIALTASGQLDAGQWKLHPYFAGASATNCIDTGDKIYYIAGGSLFAFDKESQTNSLLDVQGKLNDINITQIYYNYDNHYLVIAYQDCNIDIIKEDGQIVNIPDFKEAALPKAKTINDVTFANGKAYVATSFGHLIIDDNTLNIIEFGNYQYNIPSAAVVGDIFVLSFNNQFWYFGADEETEKIWNHKTFYNNIGPGKIYPINDSKFFFTSSNAFYVIKVGHGTGDDGVDTCSFTLTKIESAAPVTVQPTTTGFVASFQGNGYYYTFDKSGDNPQKNDGNELYTSQENGNWWVLGNDGLAHIVNGTKGEYIKANGITITQNAYWTTYDASQQRILLCRTTDNAILQTADAGATTEINAWDGNTWKDITPTDATPDGQGNYWIVVSPNEPNTYYYAYRKYMGVCKVQNDAIVTTYTDKNSPLCDRGIALRFDSKGNLWMVQSRHGKNNREEQKIDAVVITPENQRLSQVDSSKFIINYLDGLCWSAGFKRMSLSIGAGDTKVYCPGDYQKPLVVWNNNEDLSPKQYKALTTLIDQNNKEFTFNQIIITKSDNNGMIWVGTSSGLFWFDPRDAFNEDFRINRVYINNNTEELLSGSQVNCIETDAQNRIWIGTNSMGVYLLNAEGTEITHHFDTSNSMLPSDKIYSVCCHQATGAVLIVTPSGVVEYREDITPGAQSYNNVYAFPNPVQSSFTGFVTIKNLMENSNVLITDIDGNIVSRLKSRGGTALWDGCDSNGNRLETGIYKVFASQGTPSTSGTPVTRIAIVK